MNDMKISKPLALAAACALAAYAMPAVVSAGECHIYSHCTEKY